MEGITSKKLKLIRRGSEVVFNEVDSGWEGYCERKEIESIREDGGVYEWWWDIDLLK